MRMDVFSDILLTPTQFLAVRERKFFQILQKFPKVIYTKAEPFLFKKVLYKNNNACRMQYFYYLKMQKLVFSKLLTLYM